MIKNTAEKMTLGITAAGTALLTLSLLKRLPDNSTLWSGISTAYLLAAIAGMVYLKGQAGSREVVPFISAAVVATILSASFRIFEITGGAQLLSTGSIYQSVVHFSVIVPSVTSFMIPLGAVQKFKSQLVTASIPSIVLVFIVLVDIVNGKGFNAMFVLLYYGGLFTVGVGFGLPLFLYTRYLRLDSIN